MLSVFAVNFSCTYITNKTEHFSFKSVHAVRVADLVKED